MGLKTVLLAAAIVSLPGCVDHDAKKQLLVFYSRINQHTTEREIQAWASEPGFRKLSVGTVVNSSLPVMTPLEFGATNWWICMTFKGTKLVRAKIGTEDSCSEDPKGAPSPKVFDAGAGT